MDFPRDGKGNGNGDCRTNARKGTLLARTKYSFLAKQDEIRSWSNFQRRGRSSLCRVNLETGMPMRPSLSVDRTETQTLKSPDQRLRLEFR